MATSPKRQDPSISPQQPPLATLKRKRCPALKRGTFRAERNSMTYIHDHKWLFIVLMIVATALALWDMIGSFIG